ncbi:MAG: NYN domain-containing protein [Actinomycetota bacterium]
MDLDRVTMDLLRPAADALRRALQRMDDEDVPASLRTLADSSARRLPPPILKRALTELDRSEWLRAETIQAEEMEDTSPSGLFVLRPAGWEEQLERMAEGVSDQQEERVRSQLEKRLADAGVRIEQLEERLQSGADDVAAAEQRVRSRLREQIESAERARRAAERRAREEAQAAARLASRAERLQAELDAAEQRLETLRQLLEKERRAGSPPGEEGYERGWFPDEPREMAEELDRIFTAVRRGPRPSQGPDPGPPPVKVPEGVRPDRMEVIHWLMRHPLRWLIDGYNVAFQVAGSPDSSTRARLASAAGRLASMAASGSMVVVVFDSSVDTSTLPTDRRVRVVYVHSADEWIVEHAGPNTVVVSSDRAVREDSEEAGAIGVWSEALGAWISAGSPLGG